VFSAAGLAGARSALLCLINGVRASYGLAPLTESPALDAHAQSHPGQAWKPPGVHLYGGAELFEGTGPNTPYAVVAGWMRSRLACVDLLSPMTEAGFGAVDHPVIQSPPQGSQPAFGVAPAWTAIVLATSQGPDNQSATTSCPHPLPVDAAGQGRPRPAHQSVTDLFVAQAKRRGAAIVLDLVGQVRGHLVAQLTITAPGGARRSLGVQGLRSGAQHFVRVGFGAGALRRATPGSIVRILVTEASPRRSVYLFELRL